MLSACLAPHGYPQRRRQCTVANSNYRNPTVRTRALHGYLRWRNKSARNPEVPTVQRLERARIRGEKASAGAAEPSPEQPDGQADITDERLPVDKVSQDSRDG
ncbi:hypothetical protein GCM10010521_61230 [Streptomyces rameus]|uniref:Uncharacterized protein n=1 Tax=Streptomyces rameus TaxID=68261 RepID=A0ABP6HH44_9ACTN